MGNKKDYLHTKQDVDDDNVDCGETKYVFHGLCNGSSLVDPIPLFRSVTVLSLMNRSRLGLFILLLNEKYHNQLLASRWSSPLALAHNSIYMRSQPCC